MIANYYDYFVSSNGHVYEVNSGKEIPIWRDSKAGYCNVSLNIEGKRRIRKVHRLVAIVYIPNPNEELLDEVNHKDGNKENNDVSNLEWSNSYLNNKHARETGLNDIAKSNSERWRDKNFEIRAKRNMSIAAYKRDLNGERNPNFKIYLEYKGKKYTLKEFAPKMSLTYSGLYQKVQKIIKEGHYCFQFETGFVYILKG